MRPRIRQVPATPRTRVRPTARAAARERLRPEEDEIEAHQLCDDGQAAAPPAGNAEERGGKADQAVFVEEGGEQALRVAPSVFSTTAS